MKPEDFWDSWSYANPNMGYRFTPRGDFYEDSQAWLDDKLRDNAEHNRKWDERNANKTVIVTELPDSYIDGGLVLKSGVTVSRNEFAEMDYHDWKEFEKLVQGIPNIVCDEIVNQKMLWIYDVPPVITSMAA